MSVGNILQMTGNKMGLNPSDPSSRPTLLRFLNQACYEIYNIADIPGTMMEQVLQVNGDQTISLPWYIGELRAIREYYSQIPWNINQMRPRYNQSNWPESWRNWRIRNRGCLQATVTNQSVLNVTVPQVDNPPITVTVTGQTTTATKTSEALTMTSVMMQTVGQFLDVFSFSKSSVTDYDVVLTDVDGKLLSEIPNTELQAWYQIVDVSSMPWLPQVSSTQDHFVEVLYKKTLPYLSDDTDEFPAVGYDFIISDKMMQVWAVEQGKADVALQYDQLTSRSLGRKVEEANRATQDKIALVVNPHDTLLPRIRSRRPSRYGGYGSNGLYGNL